MLAVGSVPWCQLFETGDMTRLFCVAHWDSWFVSPLGMSQPQEQKPQAVTRLCSLHTVSLATPRPDTGGQLGGQPRSHILRGVTDAQQREGARGVTPGHVVGDDWRGDGAVGTLMGEAFLEVFPLPLLWLYLPAVLAVPLGSCLWVLHTPYPRWLDQCSAWSGGAA